VLGSIALYAFWRPAQFGNYGDLVGPLPLAEVSLRRSDGSSFRFQELHGKWVLLTVDSGDCDEHCRRKLYYMRQVRLTQGKEGDRIERVWLITGRPAPAVLVEEYPGMLQIRLAASETLSWLPAPGAVTDHVFVVDPLGNLMMRYPREVDPSRMKKDVARLLKLSGWVQGK
jgi:hypothetical protein